jgi:3alpha(or 20beta)-hydroxysteroid dehydrogenase
MAEFQNRTVLITGGASGMGASHARGFAAAGANVVVTDIQESRGRAIAEELGARGIFLKLDVRDPSDWESAVREAEQRFSPVSVLVNNAGILVPNALIEHSAVDDWDNVIRTNLTGQYLGIRATVPSMRRAGGGAIVNIASTTSHVGTSFIGAYSTSKWGVRGLTQTAAQELARDNIRVNSVSPGVVNTPLLTAPLREGDVPIADVFPAHLYAVKRLAEPQEITRLVMFLASDASAFITGSDYVADGGYLVGPSVPPDA